MKTHKLFLIIAALFVGTIYASAIPAGCFAISMDGGTTVLPAMSTNVFYSAGVTNYIGNPGTPTNLVVNVDEFDYVGLTISLTGTANSTNSFLVYASNDNGVIFGSVPLYQFLNIAPGSAAYVTNTAIDVHGVTHIAFTVKSSGTTPATNVCVKVNLKSPKFGAKPATR